MGDLLKAIQLSTIAQLREKLGGEAFIYWLTRPTSLDGMSPIAALDKGLWQEAAELADSAFEMLSSQDEI